jgi:hypothetical protein
LHTKSKVTKKITFFSSKAIFSALKSRPFSKKKHLFSVHAPEGLRIPIPGVLLPQLSFCG